MATTTNFGWTTPNDTDLVKDGASSIRTLGSAIDASMADLKGGTTGQALTKNSNSDMDFVWSTVDPLLILDAKGDLISATAADTPARLAVGSNGQVLTADSTASTGLKWASPAASGILQVVQSTYSTPTSNGTTGYTDTGITATITPSSSSSKILALVTIAGMYRSSNDCSASFQLLRGSTVVSIFENNIMNSGGTANQTSSTGTNYLDSPATTSATTYKVQFKRNPSSGGTININLSDSISTITLMEVSG